MLVTILLEEEQQESFNCAQVSQDEHFVLVQDMCHPEEPFDRLWTMLA